MVELEEIKSTDLLILEQLVKLNEKEGKLIELAVETRNIAKDDLNTSKKILKRKDEQKAGDIKHRKLSDKQSKIGILIACAALFISIIGFDGGLTGLIMGLFKG